MAFRLSDNRCEKIKEIVVNTFEELDIRCIPISGFEMATKLGAVVVPYSSKSEETRQLMLKESEDGFSAKKFQSVPKVQFRFGLRLRASRRR